jgi:hypothetical protein
MYSRPDAERVQVSPSVFPMGRPDDVLMKDVLYSGPADRPMHRRRCESIVVCCRNLPTAGIPRVQSAQSHAKDRGLYLIESRIHSSFVANIASPPTVLP